MVSIEELKNKRDQLKKENDLADQEAEIIKQIREEEAKKKERNPLRKFIKEWF